MRIRHVWMRKRPTGSGRLPAQRQCQIFFKSLEFQGQELYECTHSLRHFDLILFLSGLNGGLSAVALQPDLHVMSLSMGQSTRLSCS